MSRERTARRTTWRGLAAVEVAASIATVALLGGIMLPALGRFGAARAGSAAAANLARWGEGLSMFAQDHDGLLPWAGDATPAGRAASVRSDLLWANAVPPYVDGLAYRDLDDVGGSMFLDADAPLPAWAPRRRATGGGDAPFVSAVAPNALVLRGDPRGAVAPALEASLPLVPRPARTVLMLEVRLDADELPARDPLHDVAVAPSPVCADWHHFAARHAGGGFLLFADGAVDWLSNRMARPSGTSEATVARAAGRPIWAPFDPAD